MQTYYGTKRVEAWPAHPPTVTGDLPTLGYGVRYADGYESWSPKDVFEAAYHPADNMGFEGALCAMREGRKVRRIGIDDDDVTIWLDGERFLSRRGDRPPGTWMPSAASVLANWMVVE